LSAAVQGGNEFDARVAVVLYATIAGAMCVSWLVLFHVLSIHPYLVEDDVDPDFFPKERFRATLGIILYAIAGLTVWLSTPKLALLIFLALPVFYGIASEGLTETPIRLKFGKAHRRALENSDVLANSNAEGLRTEERLLAISPRPTTAYNLHRRQPVSPHRRIDRRAIGPFQATEQKRDLLDGLVMAAPNGLEEDAHRVIALNHRDRIGRFDHGCPVTPSAPERHADFRRAPPPP
jgi:hypothetical protein